MEDSSKYKHGIGDLILVKHNGGGKNKAVYALGIIKSIQTVKLKYGNEPELIEETLYYLDWTYHGTHEDLLDGTPFKESDIKHYKEKLKKFKKDNNIS
jgi:hypothetical protein